MKASANAIQFSSIHAFQPLFWSGVMAASTGAAFGLQHAPPAMLHGSIAAWPDVAGAITAPPQIKGLSIRVAPDFASPRAEPAGAAAGAAAAAAAADLTPLLKPLLPFETARANPGYVLRIELPAPTKAEAAGSAVPLSAQIALPAAIAPSQEAAAGEPAAPTAAVAAESPQAASPELVAGPTDQSPSVPGESAPPEMVALAAGPAILPSRFDLAQLSSPQPDQVREMAARLRASAGSARPAARLASADSSADAKRDRIVDGAVAHTVAVSINGDDAGRIEVRIRDDHSPEVRVSDVLALVQNMMPADAYGALSGSASAREFVTFNQIRSAGIDVRYVAGTDTIALSAS